MTITLPSFSAPFVPKGAFSFYAAAPIGIPSFRLILPTSPIPFSVCFFSCFFVSRTAFAKGLTTGPMADARPAKLPARPERSSPCIHVPVACPSLENRPRMPSSPAVSGVSRPLRSTPPSIPATTLLTLPSTLLSSGATVWARPLMVWAKVSTSGSTASVIGVNAPCRLDFTLSSEAFRVSFSLSIPASPPPSTPSAPVTSGPPMAEMPLPRPRIPLCSFFSDCSPFAAHSSSLALLCSTAAFCFSSAFVCSSVAFCAS